MYQTRTVSIFCTVFSETIAAVKKTFIGKRTFAQNFLCKAAYVLDRKEIY